MPNKRGVDETYDWVAEWMDGDNGETTEDRRETKTYNLLMTVGQYDKLATISEHRQKTALEQVSVADLIREAIDLYIHVIEQEEQDEKTGTEG